MKLSFCLLAATIAAASAFAPSKVNFARTEVSLNAEKGAKRKAALKVSAGQLIHFIDILYSRM